MRLPRWMHKLYANLNGYFWLPCPICGEPFGGHEWGDESVSLELGGGLAQGICNKPECSVESRRRNDAAGFPRYVRVTELHNQYSSQEKP